MAVPRNRTSNARKNSRRSHHAKEPRHFSKCKNCDNLKMPHVVCSVCGVYGERQVIKVSA